MPSKRLNVFLCHSSQDKPVVRELYDYLLAEGWIDPWLDKAKILPGEDWRMVIEKAVEESDLVVVCLSNHSVNKEGFVQKEIRYASDIALEKPEGTIFMIPIRLEDCAVPRGLRTLQWIDYFGKEKDKNYKSLLEVMKRRAGTVGVEVDIESTRVLVAVAAGQSLFRDGLVGLLYAAGFSVVGQAEDGQMAVEQALRLEPDLILLDLHMPTMNGLAALQQIKQKQPATRVVILAVPEDEAYLVDAMRAGANGYLYKHLNAMEFMDALKNLQRGELAISMKSTTVAAGVDTPKERRAASLTHENKIILPNGMEFMRVPAGKFIMGSNEYDNEKPQHIVDVPYDYWMGRFPITNVQYSQFKKRDFDKGKVNHPVVYVAWNDAQKYIKWLNEKFVSQLPKGYIFSLPNEAEWEKAARGGKGLIYPWGNKFDRNKCNSNEGGKNDTTPVDFYSPRGNSPYDCADMAGNVYEWTRSLYNFKYPYQVDDGREDKKASGYRAVRGGSYYSDKQNVRCAIRNVSSIDSDIVGFRVCASPISPV